MAIVGIIYSKYVFLKIIICMNIIVLNIERFSLNLK